MEQWSLQYVSFDSSVGSQPTLKRGGQYFRVMQDFNNLNVSNPLLNEMKKGGQIVLLFNQC